jgi:ubiquitin carboxyl-terminal hydrolase 5/13
MSTEMNTCVHLETLELRNPLPQAKIFKEECTYCFESPFADEGLDICLTCYNGGCLGESKHSQLHYRKTHHPLVVNVKQTKLVRSSKAEEFIYISFTITLSI